jgi:hypothetical protein
MTKLRSDSIAHFESGGAYFLKLQRNVRRRCARSASVCLSAAANTFWRF